MAQGRPGQKERGQKQKRFPGTAELAVRQASKGVAPECETDDQEKASGLSFLKGPSRQKRPQQKCLPVAASHTRAVLSKLAVTMRAPSGLNAATPPAPAMLAGSRERTIWGKRRSAGTACTRSATGPAPRRAIIPERCAASGGVFEVDYACQLPCARPRRGAHPHSKRRWDRAGVGRRYRQAARPLQRPRK